MNLWKTTFLLLPLLGSLLSSCTTTTPPEGSNTSGTVYGPEPTSNIQQTVQMQDEINRVNRSLVRF